MLKEDFPIYFDSTEITIKHRQWARSYANIITVNTTEAGTDDVEYLRFGKTSIRAQFRCMDGWVSTFAEFSHKPAITVKFYDVELKAYIEKSMRMEGFSVTEIPKSVDIDVTNGIYDVSFNLVEF